MSECLHLGSFSTSVPAVQRKVAFSEWGIEKHEVGHRLQGLVTRIYKYLTVSDVPVCRSVTVSNELHLPLLFINWTDFVSSQLKKMQQLQYMSAFSVNTS